jgi:hypothetical protein
MSIATYNITNLLSSTTEARSSRGAQDRALMTSKTRQRRKHDDESRGPWRAVGFDVLLGGRPPISSTAGIDYVSTFQGRGLTAISLLALRTIERDEVRRRFRRPPASPSSTGA